MNYFSGIASSENEKRLDEILYYWEESRYRFERNLSEEDIDLFLTKFKFEDYGKALYRGLEILKSDIPDGYSLMDYIDEVLEYEGSRFLSSTYDYSIAKEFAGNDYDNKDTIKVIVTMSYDGYLDISDSTREKEVIIVNPSYMKIVEGI